MGDGSKQPEEGKDRPERDRFGLLSGRTWYRHPFVIISAAGVVFYLLNLWVAANRTGAGVPLFQ